MHNNLTGIWKSDPLDVATQRQYGDVTMEFHSNGELIYTVLNGDREQKIFMTYEVKDNFLITDQPSFPEKEITEFILTNDRLELKLDSIVSKYIKIK